MEHLAELACQYMIIIQAMELRRWLLVDCMASQPHSIVSQGQIYAQFTCCHTETKVVDQTFNLTQSQFTATIPTSSGADPVTPGAWQGNHWKNKF